MVSEIFLEAGRGCGNHRTTGSLQGIMRENRRYSRRLMSSVVAVPYRCTRCGLCIKGLSPCLSSSFCPSVHLLFSTLIVVPKQLAAKSIKKVASPSFLPQPMSALSCPLRSCQNGGNRTVPQLQPSQELSTVAQTFPISAGAVLQELSTVPAPPFQPLQGAA